MEHANNVRVAQTLRTKIEDIQQQQKLLTDEARKHRDVVRALTRKTAPALELRPAQKKPDQLVTPVPSNDRVLAATIDNERPTHVLAGLAHTEKSTISGPYIDDNGPYGVLASGQKIYYQKLTGFVDASGTPHLDGPLEEDDDKGSEPDGQPSDGQPADEYAPYEGPCAGPLYYDHDRDLPYVTVISDKKYKRIIDVDNDTYYDVTDSDQSEIEGESDG